LQKASLIAEKINNTNALVEIYSEISKAFSNAKDIYNSTKYLLDAIHLAEGLRDPDLIANIYFTAGALGIAGLGYLKFHLCSLSQILKYLLIVDFANPTLSAIACIVYHLDLSNKISLL
jgi:hypothetical protein